MSQQPIYGFPCVEDPHDFDPDRECCSPEEIATWRKACDTYGTPDYKPNEGCFEERDADGHLIMHVARTSWGIGVNLIKSCDGCNEPDFDGDHLVCHECHEQEFCPVCWTKHEKEHEVGG